jgi:hypothetical protein
MIRHITAGIGAVAALSAAVLASPAAAHAAVGQVIINGQAYQDPSGCYGSDSWPLSVQNQTDQTIRVYNGEDCSGIVIALVYPGQSQVSEFGESVLVP